VVSKPARPSLISYRAVVRAGGREVSLDFAAGNEHQAHLMLPHLVARAAPEERSYELLSLVSEPEAAWHHTRTLDRREAQVRDVFAAYGAAMEHCQALERVLGAFLALALGPSPEAPHGEELERLLQRNFRETLGTLVRRLRGRLPDGEDLEDALGNALEIRNWLAHDYYWERVADFQSGEGRVRMLAELEEAAARLGEAGDRINAVTREWARRHGIRPEDHAVEVDRIVRGDAPAPWARQARAEGK
jgi:hypothetical protein